MPFPHEFDPPLDAGIGTPPPLDAGRPVDAPCDVVTCTDAIRPDDGPGFSWRDAAGEPIASPIPGGSSARWLATRRDTGFQGLVLELGATTASVWFALDVRIVSPESPLQVRVDETPAALVLRDASDDSVLIAIQRGTYDGTLGGHAYVAPGTLVGPFTVDPERSLCTVTYPSGFGCDRTWSSLELTLHGDEDLALLPGSRTIASAGGVAYAVTHAGTAVRGGGCVDECADIRPATMQLDVVREDLVEAD